MNNVLRQLESFPNAVNVIKKEEELMHLITTSGEQDDVMFYYQKFVLNITRKVIFNPLTSIQNSFSRLIHFNKEESYKTETFTGGELDEYRFYFNGDNSDIISEFLKCKETHYYLDIETLHNYYIECLDEDPANGEYLYHVIRTFYLKKDYKSSLLLAEKYLLLNDKDRMYNKHKVLIIAISILADVYQKYDDAVTYTGDLLSIIDNDFTKPKSEKGFAYFYKEIQNRVAVQIYIT